MSDRPINGEISHWIYQQAASASRPRLRGRERVDVAIVGAGLTGLWTAWHLTRLAPQLRVAVIEAEQVGFGASGRNGGWLSHLVPGNRAIYAKDAAGATGVIALQRTLIDTIEEVVATAEELGLDIDLARGGNTVVAHTPAGLQRLRARREADLRAGLLDQEVLWLDAGRVSDRVKAPGALGGLHYPMVARINPAKLVTGLARAVEAAGVTIYEGCPVLGVSDGAARTRQGKVEADAVLICVEGYGGPLVGGRKLTPVNSSMIVTRPLTPPEWDTVGWAHRDCLSDAAHTFVYAQRTADDRIAIGGRGRPYRWRSGTGGAGEVPASTVDDLTDRLNRFFPALGLRVDRDIDHAWSGVLGVTRDWCATVGYDRATRVGAAYGYAGHGVTATHLASRVLVDLVLDRQTEATRLPLVDHRSPLWEHEPLRWVGIHGMYRLFRGADRWEEARGSSGTSALARLGGRLAGLAE